MKQTLIEFNPWPLVIAIVFFIGVWVGLKVNKSDFDLPEEFNIHTISRDRSKPTEMMVVYDTTSNKYTFEFIDK